MLCGNGSRSLPQKGSFFHICHIFGGVRLHCVRSGRIQCYRSLARRRGKAVALASGSDCVHDGLGLFPIGLRTRAVKFRDEGLFRIVDLKIREDGALARFHVG